MKNTEYSVTTDRERMDLRFVHDFLSTKSYWAQGRAREIVERSMENSLCFGVFSPDGQQVGFARLVTDYATFAWLCDVFIDEAHRGKGLGKKLIQAVVSNPSVKGIKRIVLGTRDAHGLYRQYGGFQPIANPERWMERPAT
ncbi:MAG TPA: GNAT family N-acetyltransferase [Spirochaetia bacterium]|nr:GNAT family N-acetyltransferase [Spirochaetia bacterium]